MSSKYCERHGHATPYGAKPGDEFTCLNCGVASVFLNAPAVIETPTGPVMPVMPAAAERGTRNIFQGDGQPATKPSNPKDAIGATKLPIHLVPSAVTRYASLAYFEGASKYGKYNWRVAGARMSIYLDAIHRHLLKLQDGEWADGDMVDPAEPVDLEAPPTHVPHLASIIACCGIILDAYEVNKLNDDRPPINPVAGANMDVMKKHLAHLKTIFAAYSPHQHVITDES